MNFFDKLRNFWGALKVTWQELGFAVGFLLAFGFGLFHQWIGNVISGFVAAFFVWIFIATWKEVI